MAGSKPALGASVDDVLATLPAVWDRIRSTLRSAGTARFGITLEQFHVLRHIRDGYGTVGELAVKRQVSRSAVSQAVTVLVARGLVTRHAGQKDRRSVRLELTPHALQVMRRNRRETAAWMASSMKGLPARDLAVLRAAMRILRDAFVGETVK